jgi:hypothetical protein
MSPEQIAIYKQKTTERKKLVDNVFFLQAIKATYEQL